MLPQLSPSVCSFPSFHPKQGSQDQMSENEIELTRVERLILWNQYHILEGLNPGEADQYSVEKEILERGYEPFYGRLVEHIYDDEHKLTHDEKLEVWDTLDMFDSLKTSADQLGKPELLSSYPVSSFRGYDGNNESKFLALTAFTIKRLKRFEHVDLPPSGSCNSHSPMRPIYLKMLAQWRNVPLAGRSHLSEAQIKDILGAGGTD